MVVICDTFDHEDFPVYFDDHAEALKRKTNLGSMERYMESYDLKAPMEPQMKNMRNHVL